MSSIHPFLLVLLASLVLASCGSSVEKLDKPEKISSLSEARAFDFAENFRLNYVEGRRYLEVYTAADKRSGSGEDSNAWLSYRLLRDGEEPIEGENNISIPVKRVVCTSTTHAALFSRLDARDVIVGMAWPENLSDSLLRQAWQAREIQDVAREMDLNHEVILDLEPDAVVAFVSSDPGYGDFDKMRDLNLPVLANVEYLESTPLGQAEWMRFAGILLDQEERADSLFRLVADRYLFLADSVAALDHEAPTVFTGLDWKGVWTVPKGNSFAATFLADAGANYLWSDESGTGNLPLDFEAVFDRAVNADVWLHPGAARSVAELTERDPRLANFQAWKESQVWNRDARVLENGANDYWESGIVRPDLVLEDLIQILHNPEAPERLNYYRRLP